MDMLCDFHRLLQLLVRSYYSQIAYFKGFGKGAKIIKGWRLLVGHSINTHLEASCTVNFSEPFEGALVGIYSSQGG